MNSQEVHEGLAGPPPDPNDAWTLHEPGYRGEIARFAILAYFALSPSTKKVVYATGKRPRQVFEIRCYGPEGSLVWFSVPERPSVSLRMDMRRLYRRLLSTGKLQKGMKLL